MPPTRRLTLDVADRPDVLPRVVTTCRRRGCQIVALTYAGGDRHRPGRIEIAIAAPERHAARLAGHLRGLVDVRAVTEA